MGSFTISRGHWQKLADTLNKAKYRHVRNDMAAFDMCEYIKDNFSEDFPQLAKIMQELNELLYADMRRAYRDFKDSAPELKLVEDETTSCTVVEVVGLIDFILYQFHSNHPFLEKLAKLRNKAATVYVRGLPDYKYGL